MTRQHPRSGYLFKLLFLDVQQTLNPLHHFSEMLALQMTKGVCAHMAHARLHGRPGWSPWLSGADLEHPAGQQ